MLVADAQLLSPIAASGRGVAAGSLDALVAFHVLEHMVDPIGAISGWLTALSAGITALSPGITARCVLAHRPWPW